MIHPLVSPVATVPLVATVAAVWLAMAPQPTVAAGVPSHGTGAPKLEAKVDGWVQELIAQRNLPGVSVAVMRGGKLVLAKGYGYANAQTKEPMLDDARMRIGSVTKASVTGPAAWGLLKAKGIDPKTRKVYGPGGVFGSEFAPDVATGVGRHTPIIDIAIGPDDKVYAYYRDGTYSVGTSADLAQHAAPKPYTLPAGTRIIDLRGISMTGAGHVYSWFDTDDGLKVAIGSPGDLGAVQGLSQGAVKIPRPQSAASIVGIGIAKSNGHVYVHYDDGTFSSGTSTDFDFYQALKPYGQAPGSGGTSYDIRGVDIASDNHLYAWFGNGKASSGRSDHLDAYRVPYAYKVPSGRTPDWSAWYGKITLQNILDHRAGFEGSGDEAGAARMFGVDPADLTYEQVHRHFLRTHRLLFEPGTAGAYSNHGFGLWTLLIESISGRAYGDYVRGHYLAPLGMADHIVPEKSGWTQECRDAWNHSFDGDDQPIPFAFEDSGLGLAAGGFRVSARDLVRLLGRLKGQYSDSDLNAMGWGQESRGKLEHSGSSSGGTAHAAMFPKGYVSLSGRDLSDISVVLITNIDSKAKDKAGNELPSIASKFEQLAGDIALEVPVSDIAAGYEVKIGKRLVQTCVLPKPAN
jgi:CubicO group peptidase (beta-lactamase class C family)